jgi:flagellar basal-body rod modification protein FlgD
MSTTPVTATDATTTAATTSTKPANGLVADSDTFLKLLVANMQHQDPLQPQDSAAYMAQLSQMSMVEQLTSLADTTKTAAKDQANASAVSLLGRTVSYIGPDGTAVTGTVQRVEVAGDKPTLTIDGVDGIDTSLITEVAQP